jgi:hypothetical protein
MLPPAGRGNRHPDQATPLTAAGGGRSGGFLMIFVGQGAHANHCEWMVTLGAMRGRLRVGKSFPAGARL